MTNSSSARPAYLDYIDDSSLDRPNEKQRDFIRRDSEDFAILQGPPGTGKSLALAHAILDQAYRWIIASNGAKHALVVAPSHRAVNATLRKVDQFKYAVMQQTDCEVFSSLRLVRALSRDRDNRPDTRTNVEFFNYNAADDDELDQFQHDLVGQQGITSWGSSTDSLIIFGTPSGGNRIIKKSFGETIRPTFDLFAVDEASMMTATDFLMAGSSTSDGARTLITGDHRQLSPIQKHDWDEEKRRTIRERVPYLSVMDLFRLLSEKDEFGTEEQFGEVDRVGTVNYPIDRLELTYRCDREVARILKDLVYERDGIEYRSYLEDDPSRSGEEKSLAVTRTGNEPVDTALDPNCPITIVVHQDNESQQSNALEAGIVDRFIEPLNLDQETLGVITPHNAQRGRLIDMLGDKVPDGAIDTVDRFQGSERDVIILSGTVSDPDYIRKETEFILSPNRLNVAVSRMKKKLIVIVSESLIEFIPSDAEDYDNARLWKLLLSKVSDASGGQAIWEGNIRALLEGTVDPMPLNESVNIYTISR